MIFVVVFFQSPRQQSVLSVDEVVGELDEIRHVHGGVDGMGRREVEEDAGLLQEVLCVVVTRKRRVRSGKVEIECEFDT